MTRQLRAILKGTLTCAALIGCGAACRPAFGQSPPVNTGSSQGIYGGFSILADTTGEIQELPAEAIVVTAQPSTWASIPGAKWIGPAADQSVASRTGTTGTTTHYDLEFDLTNCGSPCDPTHYSGLTITIAAAGYVDVDLNGTNKFTHTSTNMSTSSVTFPVSSGFKVTDNVLNFYVTAPTGGPTGLDVSFAAGSTTPPTSSLGASTSRATYSLDALPDAVDAASGQFYETDSEIELGGPMNLGFRRYYSSQLSSGKVSTALGTNWMSNFDERAVVSGTNAQVLLFGGKIVSFTNSGGTWELVAPKDTLYQFIQSGTNYQFLDPDSKWIYTFTPAGALTSISDRNGNTVTVTQGANGPSQVSDGLGRTLAFTYASGQVTQVTDQAARTVSFTYSSGLLASVTDIYNQMTAYSYTTVGTSAGLMTHKQLPLGNIPVSQTYDSQGRVLTQRVVTGNNGNAYTTTIAYDGNGGTTITDALGNVTKMVGSGAGNVTQLSDPAGATAAVTFDSSDRRTSITDKLGNRTSYTYDSLSGRLASVIDALGNTASLTYLQQAQGGFTFYRLSGISYPDGTSVAGTFDSNGNQLTGTAQNGTVTTYVYDAHGRPVSITGPNQQTSTYVWNADTTLASATDPLGNKRTFSYDNTKRITSTVGPNSDTTGYVWDKSTAGPMLAIIFPVSGESTTIYGDGNREIQNLVNSTGGVSHSDYTATGQLADFIDPLKNQTTYAYDGDDRISSITKPAGDVYSYAYDSVNRVTSISDANGPRTSYTYTVESKIATAADGSGRKASYVYDAVGRLSTITSPGGNTYKTGYDKFGKVINRTDPLGQVETLTRDATGALASATLPGPITTTLARDAEGAITSLTTPNGNTWKIGRDALERPTKYTDPLGNSTTLSFTGRQLTAATLPLGTLAITNNADGRVTQRKYSDGTTINTAYDTNRLLISADGVTITRDIAGHPTNINGIGITLDADGRPATLTYASGKTVTYSYDQGGRLASVADWVGGKTTVAYDGAGRMTSLTYPNGVVTAYTYDVDGNLTGIAAGSLASIALTRDATGKITSAARNVPIQPALQAASQQFSYDAAGQLTSASSDTMGRVTAQNGRTYKWNLASQLTSFLDAANTGAFTYDGLGEMNSSTASGAAEAYVYNYLFPLPALSIVRKGTGDLRYYVYFPNGTLLYSVEAADNTRHFYLFDEMGNTVLLTDDSGRLTDSYAVTPYGEVPDHYGTTDNPFTWQGQYGVIQEGTGLFYVRSRHYDASAARFISRDPKPSTDPRSAEPYAYAGGNPLRFIDPYGADLTYPTAQSPLASADAEAYANNYASGLSDFLYNNIVGQNLDTATWNSYQHLVTEVRDNPDLDWQDWAADPDNQIGGFVPPLAAYQPPASTFVVSTIPAPVQTAGPVVLAPPTCGKFGTCNGAAASQTGLAQTGSNGNALISQDGGGLISQDGGGLISQDGGGLISQDGGGLISQDGGGLISQDGGGIVGNANASLIQFTQ